jgi:very-short-patch-repair endonuclease
VSIRHGTRWIGRVDLADPVLKVVIECDGFESHGGRAAFRRDLTRHTRLVAAGWRPLRVLWEQVMYEPDWVVEIVRDTVAAAAGARRTVQRPRATLPTAA